MSVTRSPPPIICVLCGIPKCPTKENKTGCLILKLMKLNVDLKTLLNFGGQALKKTLILTTPQKAQNLDFYHFLTAVQKNLLKPIGS